VQVDLATATQYMLIAYIKDVFLDFIFGAEEDEESPAHTSSYIEFFNITITSVLNSYTSGRDNVHKIHHSSSSNYNNSKVLRALKTVEFNHE
jgi:hypothetical protein